jgi:hypothetical protein
MTTTPAHVQAACKAYRQQRTTGHVDGETQGHPDGRSAKAATEAAWDAAYAVLTEDVETPDYDAAEAQATDAATTARYRYNQTA